MSAICLRLCRVRQRWVTKLFELLQAKFAAELSSSAVVVLYAAEGLRGEVVIKQVKRKISLPGPVRPLASCALAAPWCSKVLMECSYEMNTVQVKFKKRRVGARTASFRRTPSRKVAASDDAVQSASVPSKQQRNHRIIPSELLLLDIDQNCIHRILR
jgi:hypothetical protein